MRGPLASRRARIAAAGVGIAAIVAVVATATFAGGLWPTAARPSPTVPPPPVTIRWLVAYNGGSAAPNPAYLFAERFNASQNEIRVEVEEVPRADLANTLEADVYRGDPPDILGPDGQLSLNGYQGLLLDLTDEIARQHYDMTAFEPAVFASLHQGRDGQIGIPYAIYPAYIWYDKDTFTKAGLPNLPKSVGETYQGKTWDWTTLGEVAAQLTTDQNGRKSTDPGFDKAKVATYGIDFQWADGRRMASCFGGGSFVASDGRTAQIPSVWSSAFDWYYDAIWTKHIAPDSAAVNSAYLASSNAQSSGHLAMNVAWSWSILSISGSETEANVKRWDMAVMPSLNGRISSPMDVDSFSIVKAAKHPDLAFRVLLAILADSKLSQDFTNGMPARTADQKAWFDSQDMWLVHDFPGNTVTWSVLQEMARYPTVPNIEAAMPNYARAVADSVAFYQKLQSRPGLDMNAELAALKAQLQADFDAAP